MSKTIGLTKEVLDKASGATVTHHVLSTYTVDLNAGATVAMLRSFITPLATRHVAGVNVRIPGKPHGDAEQWIYAQVIANDTEANVLNGAQPVEG